MRIEGKGRIDASQARRFTFDGRSFQGFEGDTIASALLANGVRLMGRSFKYHRPRGVLTAGSEEPNALMQIGRGAHQTPNVRATVQEVFEGLEARSQNRLGSLQFDLLSVNDLLPNFLSAGFYYKTFMWPRAFWEKLYEPVIRRAAGLGSLSGKPNPDRYEAAFAHCDILVIGSGPTGLMAALTAARGGADVILAEDSADFGGRMLDETETLDGQPAAAWVAEMLEALRDTGRVRLMNRTAVTGAYDGGTYGALERVGSHMPPAADLPQECFWRIHARQAVLAAGALERPIAFPMNDRPGIMMASGIRSYLNRYGVAAGRKVALFATNDDAHRTALDLMASGVEIAGVVDARDDAVAQGDYPLFAGAQVVSTQGRQALREITIRHRGSEQKLETDCLGVSGGWNPTLHLTCHMNGRPVWNEGISGFVPAPGAVPGLMPAGACNGDYSTTACLAAGVDAARTALTAMGGTAPDMEIPEASDQPGSGRALWLVEGKTRAWLDFANDVTSKDIKLAAQENYRSVEHMKRYTTQGMAPDQGKNSNIGALALLADATGRAIPETGTTTYRPPFVPVTMAAMGAGGHGNSFAPQRFTTSHQATVDRAAPMIEAGLWYRPTFFPRPGEKTWRQSCDREVNMVRSNVGICDVSTLGKIDIQGPDAAAFLDLVYTNMFSTLKVGKVRYGLMLREDGHVMDDGTTARMSDTHFVMTTTTAAAGEVMKHLDFVQQCLRSDLNVRCVSVTEQWAQFAVAGPRSRALLNSFLDAPIDDDTFPYMGCGSVTVSGVKARLFRISFSGEHAYELAVPSRYGDALFRQLVAQAETLGGGAYGMEALNVMRIEKGFITHSEIDGRVTAFDIGMDRMISARKMCIGKPAAQREGLKDEQRQRLVGLKPVGAVKQLTAGAHLFEQGADAVRVNDLGYVTSVGFSPGLGHFIGLGFLKNGPERIGDVVKMVDHLRGIETLVEVCNPVFLDPEGEKLRG